MMHLIKSSIEKKTQNIGTSEGLLQLALATL